MLGPEAIAATIELYIERFSEGDSDGWLSLWSPGATMEDPVGSPLKRGLDEIGAFFLESHAMADSLRLVRTGSVRVAGREAAFPMQARPVMGGVEYALDIIDVMRFDDEGLIVEMRAFWDGSTMRPA